MKLPYSHTVVFTVILSAGLLSGRTPCDREKPVAVIFDTDMGPDYDDAEAVALLPALADSGDARIPATMANVTPFSS